MLTATLKRNTIFLSGRDHEDAEAALALGAFRTKKMPEFSWMIPLSPDALQSIRKQRIPCSEDLILRARPIFDELAYVDQQKQTEKVTPLAPVPIKKGYKLYQHQVRAYNIALSLYGYPGMNTGLGACALLMDMGTGKTLSAVMVAGRMFLDHKINRVLVVAPSSVCPVWPAEFSRFGAFPTQCALLLGDRETRIKRLEALQREQPERGLKVAVINYESTWRLIDALKAYKPDLIIADESQRIKSHTAEQSKAMHALGDLATYRMILSGTPIQNDTRDVWSQYRFLCPGIFGTNYYMFERRYSVLGGFGGKQYLAPKNLDELTRKTHSIAYRVVKEECLDLPEKTYETREIQLEPEARALYKRMKQESIAELEGSVVTANIVLTRLLRLQQMIGGFVTDDDGNTLHVSSAKLEAAADLVQTICMDEQKKLVIFTRFRPEIDAVCDAAQKVLGKKKLVRIDGSTPLKDRGELVRRFQEDKATRLFVGNLAACSEGITLTAATTVVYYSLSFNAAQWQQSQDRIHRVGQHNTCTYISLIVPNTIDTKIMSALEKKTDLARSVTDNWRWILEE